MLIHKHFPIPTWVSLSVIGGILFVGVTASILANYNERRRENDRIP
jgi:hypothetical protein